MYSHFYKIAEKLNSEFSIIPLLYGSLGLQLLIDVDLNAGDIDVLIPREYINEKWEDLSSFMHGEGYILIDLHEHAFKKENVKIAFAEIDSLEEFAQISLADCQIIDSEGAKFRLFSLKQYLKVYSKSSEDSYRRNKNNDKDFDKIKLINKIIEKSYDKS